MNEICLNGIVWCLPGIGMFCTSYLGEFSILTDSCLSIDDPLEFKLLLCSLLCKLGPKMLILLLVGAKGDLFFLDFCLTWGLEKPLISILSKRGDLPILKLLSLFGCTSTRAGFSIFSLDSLYFTIAFLSFFTRFFRTIGFRTCSWIR